MKLNILTTSGSAVGKKDMPGQFSETLRPDLIKRAVEAIQSNRRQPYGPDPRAGKKACAQLSKRRRKYKCMYGHGISRTPRKILSKSGTQMNWVGALAPNTVGGRRAHPPKIDKVWDKKINKKERRKAIRSALTATMIKSLVVERGHIVPDTYPFLIEKKAESISKTKDASELLLKLGLGSELERVSERKIRPGRGKMRGRRYLTKKGPLIVVAGECPLISAASNIPGIEVVEVHRLNAELLAPGANIGRLTLFTESAVDRLTSENLFAHDYHNKQIQQNNKDEEKKKEAKEARPAQKAEKPKDEKSRQQAKSQEAKFKQPIPKKAGALAAGKTQ